MKIYSDYVSARVHYSPSFFKTIKCTALLLVRAFIISQPAAALTKSITGLEKDSIGKQWQGAGILVNPTMRIIPQMMPAGFTLKCIQANQTTGL